MSPLLALVILGFLTLAGTIHHHGMGCNMSLAKAIIIDTDIMTDCDDAGALAIANVLHNCGMCDLRAVMINTNSEYGALAASAINTYFGNGAVPIGALRPLTNEVFIDRYDWVSSDYASKLAHNWPRALNDTSQTLTPVELYLEVLQNAQDDGITIISIGFLTNIAAILNTVDGAALVSTKVKELVIMGGEYPSGREFNFYGKDLEATTTVLSSWPRSVPVTYSGFELGRQVISGANLADYASSDSPILAAYQWYSGRCQTSRESWDPLTVMYGILGLEGIVESRLPSPLFVYANENGYNQIIATNGTNAWRNDSSVTNQHWLRLADNVTEASVAWMLTQLYAHDPLNWNCFGAAMTPEQNYAHPDWLEYRRMR